MTSSCSKKSRAPAPFAAVRFLSGLLVLCVSCAGPSVRLAVDERLPHEKLRLQAAPLIAAFEAKHLESSEQEAQLVLDAVHVMQEFGRTATTYHRLWRVNTALGSRHLPQTIQSPVKNGQLIVHRLFFYDTNGRMLNNKAGLAKATPPKYPLGPTINNLTMEPPEPPYYCQLKYTVLNPREQLPAAYSACFITRGQLPIFKSVLSISSRKAGKLEIKYDGLATQPETLTADDLVTHIWTHNEIPPLLREISAPPLSELSPKISLSFNKDWRELTPALKQLLDELSRPNREMIVWANEQTAGTTGRLDKTRRIYHALQKKYHPVPGRLNLALAPPRKATELFQQENLSEHELNLLLLSLTRAAGIETVPVLMKSEASGRVLKRLPGVSQFDQLAVVLPLADADHFFYPGNTYLAPGLLPAGLAGNTALILDDSPHRFVTTPRNDAEGNVFKRDVTIIIKRQGGCTVSVLEKPTGELAAYARANVANTGINTTRLTDFYGEAKNIKTQSSDLLDTASPFEFTYYLNVENQPRRNGDQLIFPHGLFPLPDLAALVDLPRREQTLLLSRCFTLADTIHLKLPSQFHLKNKPGNVNLRFDFGSYSSHWEVEFGGLQLKRELILKKRRISPDDYHRFKSFLDRVIQDSERKIEFRLTGLEG